MSVCTGTAIPSPAPSNHNEEVASNMRPGAELTIVSAHTAIYPAFGPWSWMYLQESIQLACCHLLLECHVYDLLLVRTAWRLATRIWEGG